MLEADKTGPALTLMRSTTGSHRVTGLAEAFLVL